MRSRRLVVAIAAAVAANGGLAAAAEPLGRDVYRGGTIGDDVYAAGANVVIDAEIRATSRPRAPSFASGDGFRATSPPRAGSSP